MSQPRPRETFYGLERLGSCLTLYRGREGSLGTEVSNGGWGSPGRYPREGCPPDSSCSLHKPRLGNQYKRLI